MLSALRCEENDCIIGESDIGAGMEDLRTCSEARKDEAFGIVSVANGLVMVVLEILESVWTETCEDTGLALSLRSVEVSSGKDNDGRLLTTSCTGDTGDLLSVLACPNVVGVSGDGEGRGEICESPEETCESCKDLDVN